MNTERIKQIQQETAYPDSISVQQALLKVWNECEQDKVVNKNDLLPDVSGSLPSDEEFETALEKEAFRVPYDGSNNFYDEPTLKHWRKCWEWVKNAVSNDR